jgi:hypothetical protein
LDQPNLQEWGGEHQVSATRSDIKGIIARWIWLTVGSFDTVGRH